MPLSRQSATMPLVERSVASRDVMRIVEWNADVIFDFELPREVVDEVVTRLNLPTGLTGLSNGAVVAAAPEGRTTVVVTVDADDLAGAAVEAVRITREIVGKDPIALEVMPSAEYWAGD